MVSFFFFFFFKILYQSPFVIKTRCNESFDRFPSLPCPATATYFPQAFVFMLTGLLISLNKKINKKNKNPNEF